MELNTFVCISLLSSEWIDGHDNESTGERERERVMGVVEESMANEINRDEAKRHKITNNSKTNERELNRYGRN